MPFFSIIIPVLNASKTIEPCLNSIYKQEFNDYEVIIIEGLSNDDTLDKISSICKQRTNTKFISEKDNGVYDAMNKGVSLSSGKYLYFLGSDDNLFSSDVLNKVYESIRKENYPDMIYGNVLLGNSSVIHNGEYTLAKLYYINICHQSIFYSRQIFYKIGEFNQGYPAFADWHFNFKCFANKTVHIVYTQLLVAQFAFGGVSGRVEDPLLKSKREVFVKLAQEANRSQYYSLRKCIIDVSTFKGKIEYIYFYSLDALFHFINKFNRLKK